MKRMNPIIGCAVAATMLFAAGSARATVLYNGALGTAPETQSWLEFSKLGSATNVTAGGKTTLDTTTSSSIEAGYSNYTPSLPPPAPAPVLVNSAFPALNPAAGFDVDLTMKLDSESHSSTDRAGFSMIVLGSDHKGIELGFWSGDVWAQSGPTFTHAEDAAFTTTDTAHVYDVNILNGNYALYADGNPTPILTGVTRDYSSFGLPYSLSNFVFIGDDTTSANAAGEISNLTVTVPEPASGMAILAAAGAGLMMRHRRRARA